MSVNREYICICSNKMDINNILITKDSECCCRVVCQRIHLKSLFRLKFAQGACDVTSLTVDLCTLLPLYEYRDSSSCNNLVHSRCSSCDCAKHTAIICMTLSVDQLLYTFVLGSISHFPSTRTFVSRVAVGIKIESECLFVVWPVVQ